MRRFARLPYAFALAALLLATGGARPAHAAAPAITAEEFKLYKDYQQALSDERVLKLPEKKRLPAIAKNFKVSEKALSAAIAKGDAAGGAGIGKACEAEVKSLLDASSLKGKLNELRVDDAESHVVTYISWKNEDGAKLEEEAATAALLAAKGTPIASTVAVWAVDAKSGKKVFEAKISAEAAGRFNQERIPMFASARYIKQFEDVKNAYKGTPPAEGSN